MADHLIDLTKDESLQDILIAKYKAVCHTEIVRTVVEYSQKCGVAKDWVKPKWTTQVSVEPSGEDKVLRAKKSRFSDHFLVFIKFVAL